MSPRLSLTERNELAFKLRAAIVQLESPDKFAIDHDPDFQPHPDCAGTYAFEFLLDRFRDRLSTESKDQIAYTAGWAIGALRRDERPLKSFRIGRIAATVHVIKCDEDGHTRRYALEWHKHFTEHGVSAFTPEQLEQMLREIWYELMFELINEYKRPAPE